MPGKTIKLYIAGDELKNIQTAELSGWSGKAYIGQRKHIQVIQNIDELLSPGIYFLLSKEEGCLQKTIYIGEADEVNRRLKNQFSQKDWWDSFVLFISKDSNLTKAHVRHLEKLFYLIARENTTAFNLINASEPPGSKLPVSDMDDMEDFLNRAIFILKHLGIIDFAKTSTAGDSENEVTQDVFYIKLTSDRKDSEGNILAGMLKVTNGGYRLLKGSFTEKEARESFLRHSYYALWKKMFDEGVFEQSEYEGVYILNKDLDFNSSSAAAAIVKNRAANGPKEWKLPNGMTLDEWESR